MEPIRFLEEIRQAYLDARDCVYKPIIHSDKLARVTSHSISSVAEDLFGCYCAERIDTDDNVRIHIDPQLSFKGSALKNNSEKRPLLIRPDLLIERNQIATCMFDIKTDVGYKRKTFLESANNRNKQIELIKGQNPTYNEGKTKISQRINISPNIKFIYIVISNHNMSAKDKKDILVGISQLPNLDIFLLIDGHPNSYGDSKLTLNKADFDRLDRALDFYLGEPCDQ